MTDLVSLATATSELSAALPSDTTALQSCLSAASRAVRRFCGRDFTQQDYDEVYDGLGFSEIVLRQFPVNNVPRVACNPQVVFNVANNDTATNQRAVATLAAVGDVDAGQTPVALALLRVASGVTTLQSVYYGAPPSALLTVAASGTGGTLAAGTYRVAYTATDGTRESGPSGDVTVTVASGQSITVTLPAAPYGSTGFNVYVSTAGGNTASETRQGSDVTGSLTVSALAGVTAPPAAGNLTLAALATSVNALGGGWAATVQSGGAGSNGYSLLASAELLANQGGQNALTSNSGSGAQFRAHVTDVTGYTVDGRNGFVRFNNASWDPVFALLNLSSSPLMSTFPADFQSVRVQYNAGYGTVPYDVQQAVLVTAKAFLYDLQTAPQYASETRKDWSYTLAKRNNGLPDEAVKILTGGGWRAYRRT